MYLGREHLTKKAAVAARSHFVCRINLPKADIIASYVYHVAEFEKKRGRSYEAALRIRLSMVQPLDLYGASGRQSASLETATM
jgi:hypothetical protein